VFQFAKTVSIMRRHKILFCEVPIPERYVADFQEGNVYHVFNRTNNRERLFLNDDNRYFFLMRYQVFLSAFVDTYCWCLLPNHFHFLVKIKDREAILENLEEKAFKEITLTEKAYVDGLITVGELIERAFRRFFQSYSLAFNKVHGRKGNLFYKPFKRVLVHGESQFTQAIVYIHANPLKHRLVTDFTKYKWSSWRSLVSGGPTSLLRNELFEWFGSKELFINAHERLAEFYYESSISIED
jgi:putative transposase